MNKVPEADWLRCWDNETILLGEKSDEKKGKRKKNGNFVLKIHIQNQVDGNSSVSNNVQFLPKLKEKKEEQEEDEAHLSAVHKSSSADPLPTK